MFCFRELFVLSSEIKDGDQEQFLNGVFGFEFDYVYFSYNIDKFVLQDIYFKIEFGQRFGIIG